MNKRKQRQQQSGNKATPSLAQLKKREKEKKTFSTASEDNQGTDYDSSSSSFGSSLASAALSAASSSSLRPRSTQHSRWEFDGSDSAQIKEFSLAEQHYPLGYIPGDFSTGSDACVDTNARNDLIYKKAMNIGTGAGKSLFPTGLMLWMSGSSIGIFSILMLVMAFTQPVQRMMSMNAQFAKCVSSESKVDISFPKLVFIGCNLAGLGLALYKCKVLGLLPSADDMTGEVIGIRPSVEFTNGGLL